MARWLWQLTDRVTGYAYQDRDAMLPVVPIAPGDRRPYLLGRQITDWTLEVALRKGFDGLFVLNRHRRDEQGRPIWTRAILREHSDADELEPEDVYIDEHASEPVFEDDPARWQEPVSMREVVSDLVADWLREEDPAAGDE